jgi:hypothetical protein
VLLSILKVIWSLNTLLCKVTLMNKLKDYLVDTSAIISFYTPLMASVEFSAGMDLQEVSYSRLYSMMFHSAFGRPYGKYRDWFANKFNTNKDSSKTKKFMVDTSALMLWQIPNYSLILYASGASLEEITLALPLGLTVGAISGRPYGYFLDKWRTYFGRKTTL